MTGHIKFLFCALAILALALMPGCSDEQPKPLTKQDIKEAIEEASRPTPIDKEVEERGKQIIRDQTKGYFGEEREQKKLKAQREYEELQERKAREQERRAREKAEKNKQAEKP